MNHRSPVTSLSTKKEQFNMVSGLVLTTTELKL